MEDVATNGVEAEDLRMRDNRAFMHRMPSPAEYENRGELWMFRHLSNRWPVWALTVGLTRNFVPGDENAAWPRAEHTREACEFLLRMRP